MVEELKRIRGLAKARNYLESNGFVLIEKNEEGDNKSFYYRKDDTFVELYFLFSRCACMVIVSNDNEQQTFEIE